MSKLSKSQGDRVTDARERLQVNKVLVGVYLYHRTSVPSVSKMKRRMCQFVQAGEIITNWTLVPCFHL